jgi:lysophospholipase L1-like esterase
MYRNLRFLILWIFSLYTLISPAQSCSPNPPAKILLMGDSWSEIMWDNKQLRNTLNHKGYGDWIEDGEYTALTGSTASMWADPSFLSLVSNQLLSKPELQVVVLLTGGNDLLAGRYANGWYASQSASEQTAFFDRTDSYIRTIINNIKVTKPGIKILICGYDYINLYNTLNEPANLLTWDNLGQPTPRQLNDAILALEQRKINIANADPDVYYVQNLGRMQNKYGYPGFFGANLAPLPGNVAPAYNPLPGGFRDFPTPTIALANNGTDPIHLSDAGYSLICNALFDHFFSPVILKAGVNASYKSAGLGNDGFVKPNNTKSTAQFRMGRDGGGNYRNIISFATGGLPDNAVINRASIFLTRSGTTLIGLPRPLDEMVCQLDIKKGNFGNQAALETIDHSATASATNIGCFVSSASTNGAKLRIDINSSALTFINTQGNTQFRFFINESLTGTVYTAFYDGDAATANKPLLEISYSLPGRPDEITTVIEYSPERVSGIKPPYPNPVHAGSLFYFHSTANSNFTIRDILGKNYLAGTTTAGENSILLPAGMPGGLYLISIPDGLQKETKPFIVIQ